MTHLYSTGHGKGDLRISEKQENFLQNNIPRWHACLRIPDEKWGIVILELDVTYRYSMSSDILAPNSNIVLNSAVVKYLKNNFPQEFEKMLKIK